MIQKLEDQSRASLLVIAAKIAIIAVFGLFLFGFFFPFFDYPNDSRGYGAEAIRLSNGEYEYTNEFLKSTGKWEFVPGGQIKTVHNTSISDSMPGIGFFGSIAYLLGGYKGLFYIGPIFMISILIISERLATNYFGKYVGLLTLIFLVINEFVFWVGRGFLSENFFTFFFLFGCFYLIKFFKDKKYSSILLASVFFTIPSFFRLNGIMIVPTELLIVIGYFSIQTIMKHKKLDRTISSSLGGCFLKKIFQKKTLVIFGLIVLPFIGFVLFYAGFNYYFFGSPLTTFYNMSDQPGRDLEKTKFENFLKIDFNRVEKYLNHFLPYPINRIDGLISDYQIVKQQVDDSFGQKIFSIITNDGKNVSGFHLGLITLLILAIASYLAIRQGKKVESLVFVCFILAFALFYSTLLLSYNRQGSGRDMLAVYPLFYMLLSYLIVRILQYKSWNHKVNKRIIINGGRILLLVALIVFIPISFFYADYSQIIKKDGFDIKNPDEWTKRFPVDLDNVPKDSIILTHYQAHSVIVYGAIPFAPVGLGSDMNSPLYQGMLQTMRELISSGHNVYAFKEPVLREERDFQFDLGTKTGLILKDYSDVFCKVEIDQVGSNQSDESCLKEWRETRYWMK
jgi:hypothetical protein